MPLLNIDRAAYDALPGHNWSRLKHALKSPASYQQALREPHDSTAYRLGRVGHLAVLEPQRVADEVAVYAERRAGKEWTAFEAANKGKEILKPDELADLQAMAAAVHGNQALAPYLAGRVELSMTWECDGMPCKGRIDLLSRGGMLLDLKTTQDASPRGFAAAVERSHYLGQMAFYFDGLRACGESVLGAALLAVEKTAPYDHALYCLSDDDLEAGRRLYRRALATVARCEWDEAWPSYQTIQQLQRPRWALANIEGDES